VDKEFNKIFCIGFNKTGTKTLESILLRLGFRIPNLSDQITKTVEQLHLGNFSPLSSLINQYDAFSDNPFATGVTYIHADALFPRSKFILTVRDPSSWFESLCNYHKKIFSVDSLDKLDPHFFKNKSFGLYNNYFYEHSRRFILDVDNYLIKERWELLYNKKIYIDMYLRRNNEIIKYFDKRKDSLLVLDVSQERDIKKILDFLGLPQLLNFNMPHLNKNHLI
jgi:hypothetical protein